MYLVAIAELATPREAEAAALAVDLGTTAYEERLNLLTGLPTVVLTTVDRAEALSLLAKIRARTGEVDANAAVLQTQRATADREVERTRRLLAVQATTSQQGDRAERDAQVLRQQLTGIQAARTSITREVASIDAQLATMDDRLQKSRIVSPGKGTVLTRYVEVGEFVQTGTALFKMAALDTLVFRAYLSGAQLSQVVLGQKVQVRVDAGSDSLRVLTGRVTWIASAAEFTPTPIQTRDERITQVYAVKVAVPNEGGRLRIGMPGELSLGSAVGGKKSTTP